MPVTSSVMGCSTLDALVDFEKVKAAVVVDDEFDGAGIGVMGEFGDADGGGLAHFVAELADSGLR